MKTALLIIDVQMALTSGELAAFEADRVIARINEVSAKVRNAEALVMFIQHESPGGPLDRGSDGWRLADGLVVEPTDLRLRKTTTDSFHLTDLQLALQSRAIDHLVICGFQSEYCVDTTARRALALGYTVTLVSDGHSTLDSPFLTAAQIVAHHNHTLQNITSFGARAMAVASADVRLTSEQNCSATRNGSKPAGSKLNWRLDA